MTELKDELVGMDNAVSSKRSEIRDLLTAYYHSKKQEIGLVEEGLTAPLVPGPVDKTGYEIIEFIIPEYRAQRQESKNLLGQIDSAVNEYQDFTTRRDMVKREFISQIKLR